MTLKAEHFIGRVLWHVPVKGQHNVRYYGLYVPGASHKRDLIREQVGATTGETIRPPEKLERTCPSCGAALLHYRSTRRKISYIKNTRPLEGFGGIVQQHVGTDRFGLGWSPPQTQVGIFDLENGRPTQRYA